MAPDHVRRPDGRKRHAHQRCSEDAQRLAILAVLAVAGDALITKSWRQCLAGERRGALAQCAASGAVTMRRLTEAGRHHHRCRRSTARQQPSRRRHGLIPATRRRYATRSRSIAGPFSTACSCAAPVRQWSRTNASDSSDYGRALEAIAAATEQAGGGRSREVVGTPSDTRPLSARVALRYMEALMAAGDRRRPSVTPPPTRARCARNSR
jgi:hypothetical protein